MGLRSKQKKSLHEIGKNVYKFDIHEEREIYKYLTCQSIKPKKQEELRQKALLFDCYKDWKKYIVDKCKTWDICKLSEFSRYLTQRERNTKPVNEYTHLVIPIVLAELVSVVAAKLLELAGIDWYQMHWIVISIVVALLIIIVAALVYPFLDFFNILFKNSMQMHLLDDYKEIVDELIADKMKCETVDPILSKNTQDTESYLAIEKDKIEIKNITADVDIELPDISIKIKQK